MMNITTFAASCRKAEKRKVQKLLEQFFNMPELDSYKIELAEAYNYFMPAKVAKPKSVFDWVALAVSTDKIRPFLCNVYCDGINIVATDGARLHLAPNDGRAIGFYCPITGNKIDLGEYYKNSFPDYRRVIPHDDGCEPYEMPETLVTESAGGISYAHNGADEGFYKKFVDAMRSLGQPFSCKRGTIEGNSLKPLIMRFDDNRIAVLMPRNIKL